jgi:hypothetical protein
MPQNREREEHVCITFNERTRQIHEAMYGKIIKLPEVLIGDHIKNFLSKVGITEEWVKKTFNIKDCNCQGRQDALNEISKKAISKADDVINEIITSVFGVYTDERAEEMAMVAYKREEEQRGKDALGSSFQNK